MKQRQNWVRAIEHPALSLFSVVFAAVSAHAVLWFYSSLDDVQTPGFDPMQPLIKWGLALAFTGFGYLASRGLAHRLLLGERVGVYALICLVLEIVEVVTNFMYSAVAIQHIMWLQGFAGSFHTFLTVLIYIVMPIVPIVTVVLAWVDMDLQRQKEGLSLGAARGSQTVAPARDYSALSRASAPRAASYANGYRGTAAAPVAPKVAKDATDANEAKQRQGGFKFPFVQRTGISGAQPKDSASSVRQMLYDPEKELAQVP